MRSVGERNAALPHTPTQKDMAALVSAAVRPTLQRERGCAYRPLLDGSPVARFGEAAVFETLLRVCREVSKLDILDLGFDDGASWERFLIFLRSRGFSTSINLIAVRDTTPDVRDATARLRATAAATGIVFDSMFMVTPSADWPGAIVRNGQALAVVANMALHHVPDDGAHVDSTRTMVLRRIRRLAPSMVIVCEADFGPDAYRMLSRLGSHASSASEVMDALAEMRELTGGPELLSHGAPLDRSASGVRITPPGGRPELPDRLENWRRRFFDAGYVPFDLNPLRGMIVHGSELPAQAVVAPDQQAMRLTWRSKPIANTSVWLPRDPNRVLLRRG